LNMPKRNGKQFDRQGNQQLKPWIKNFAGGRKAWGNGRAKQNPKFSVWFQKIFEEMGCGTPIKKLPHNDFEDFDFPGFDGIDLDDNGRLCLFRIKSLSYDFWYKVFAIWLTVKIYFVRSCASLTSTNRIWEYPNASFKEESIQWVTVGVYVPSAFEELNEVYHKSAQKWNSWTAFYLRAGNQREISERFRSRRVRAWQLWPLWILSVYGWFGELWHLLALN
jgi:hypothetical protein